MTDVISFDAARAHAIIDRHDACQSELLPILHDLQGDFGFVPDEAIPLIATRLNLSRAEIYGVMTFYHDYRHAPAGKHVLKLCQAEACQAMGSRALAAHVEAALGITLGSTTSDGRVTVEPIYCLGLCANAPSAMLDGVLIGRASPARLDRAIEALG